MIKILFVCHGNICRSPMAEFVMKDLVKKNGVENLFEIASKATSCEELGNPVYPPARRKLAEYGISCDGKTARRITQKDYDYYDFIILMDENNIRNMKRFIKVGDGEKIYLLKDFTENPGEVSDPWYTGNFDETFRDITEGCNGILKKMCGK